jgi:hypothetical protein
MVEDLRIQEVMGLNPAVYWMDVSNASYYKSNEKKKKKGRQMGHTKNNYLKNSFITLYAKCHSSSVVVGGKIKK